MDYGLTYRNINGQLNAVHCDHLSTLKILAAVLDVTGHTEIFRPAVGDDVTMGPGQYYWHADYEGMHEKAEV